MLKEGEGIMAKSALSPAIAIGVALCCAIACGFAADNASKPSVAPAGSTAPASEAKSLTAEELAAEQLRIAEKFKRFEQVIKLLAQFSDEGSAEQARLLRQVFAESQTRSLDSRFDGLVKLLRQTQLGQATGDQEKLTTELEQ